MSFPVVGSSNIYGIWCSFFIFIGWAGSSCVRIHILADLHFRQFQRNAGDKLPWRHYRVDIISWIYQGTFQLYSQFYQLNNMPLWDLFIRHPHLCKSNLVLQTLYAFLSLWYVFLCNTRSELNLTFQQIRFNTFLGSVSNYVCNNDAFYSLLISSIAFTHPELVTGRCWCWY